MTNENILKRPILTLNGKGKQQENAPLKDFPPEKEVKKSKITANKANASVDSKAKLEASLEPEYDFNAIYEELHAKFPNIINIDKPVLLAIAIRGQMLKKVNVPNSILYKWIALYFHKSNYYSMHKVGAMRYNLDGSEAGTVTKKDQAKRNKQKRQANYNNKPKFRRGNISFRKTQ